MNALRRLACASSAALILPVASAQAQASLYEQLQTFSGLNQVRTNYVDSVTAERLVRGAIVGMLQALDPHSYFLPRERLGISRPLGGRPKTCSQSPAKGT